MVPGKPKPVRSERKNNSKHDQPGTRGHCGTTLYVVHSDAILFAKNTGRLSRQRGRTEGSIGQQHRGCRHSVRTELVPPDLPGCQARSQPGADPPGSQTEQRVHRRHGSRQGRRFWAEPRVQRQQRDRCHGCVNKLSLAECRYYGRRRYPILRESRTDEGRNRLRFEHRHLLARNHPLRIVLSHVYCKYYIVQPTANR